MTWTCTMRLKGLPKTMNGFRYHRGNYGVERRKWFYAIQRAVYENRIVIPRPALTKVEINYTLGSIRQRDHDNLVSSFKTIQDCLVRHGIILDDSPKVILASSYKWVKAPRNEGFVEIEIKEVS